MRECVWFLARVGLLMLVVPLVIATGLIPVVAQTDGSEQTEINPKTVDNTLLDRPFRRIFVPQTELPEIPMDGLRPMEIDKLPLALERLVRRNNALIDPMADAAQGLRSIHAVAQLIGADLLSERTRLSWPEKPNDSMVPGSSIAIRERLSPWNLAIENSFDELNPLTLNGNVPETSSLRNDAEVGAIESNLNFAPIWVYDSLGQPTLLRRSKEVWMRWSLKPTGDSTPNRLHFEASIPKTVDGCFVILLPKSARIARSNVVSKRFNNWELAAQRLGNWPDQNPLLGTRGTVALENDYWVMEISGQEKLDFTIELGANTSRGPSLESPEDWGGDRLFSRQTLQYSILPSQIRVLGEWEWSEAANSLEPVRIELTPGIKLRSVLINEREPILELHGNAITIAPPESSTEENGFATNRFKMSAEFLYPREQLQRDSHGQILLPSIRNSNGFVLSGSTILQDQSDAKFVQVSSDPGRLESLRKTADGLHRLEFSWNRNAPEIRCNLIDRSNPREVETLVRIAVESDRCIADVRMRLTDLVFQGFQQIQVPPGWRLEPKSMLLKPQVFGDVIRFDDTDSTIGIDTNRLTSPDATLGFQLYRDLESGTDFELDQLPWIKLLDRTLRECIYVEPNATNRLSFPDKLGPWLLSEEDLTPWQRESLPRIGRTILLGTRNQRLPPLIASSIEESLVVPVETRIRRLDSLWKIEHRFGLSSQWNGMAQMHVKLPRGYQWFYESTQRFPLASQYDDQKSEWVLPLGNLSLDADSDKFASIIAIQTVDSKTASLELQPPNVSEAKRHSYQLKLSNSLVLSNNRLRSVQVTPDRTGTIYEWGQGFSGSWEILDTHESQWKQPFFFNASLDLFVDAYGDQIAEIATEVDCRGFKGRELTLLYPTGWKLTECVQRRHASDGTAMTHASISVSEASNQAKITLDPAGLHDPLWLSIRLVGPKVIQGNSVGSMMDRLSRWANPNRLEIQTPAFEFIEGQIQMEATRLWIPKEFQILEPSVESNAWWPVWDWSKAAWEFLSQGGAISNRQTAGWVSAESFKRPSALNQWRCLEMDSKHLEGSPIRLESSGVIKWAGWLAVFWALISAGLFRQFPSLLILLCFGSCLGSIWLEPPWAMLSQQVFIGLACGGLIGRIVPMISPSPHSSTPSGRSDRSSTWYTQEDGDPSVPAGGAKKGLGGIPLAILVSWLTIPIGLATVSLGTPLLGYTQDPADGSTRVIDILIPITEDGQPAGSTIYVPEELVKWIELDDRDRRQRESTAMVGSSKHVLRLDSRTFGFGTADQPLSSTYEMWITESAIGRPVRFPFSSERLKLSRFSVDGVEVLSGRLTRTDTELVWYPERSGKRTVQIESQVRMSILESPPTDVLLGTVSGASQTSPIGSLFSDKRIGKIWAISTEILPTGNAVLDVETDGVWSLWVAAFGRSINPSVGRISVQLGNKGRLEGYFHPPSSGNRNTPSIMPNDPSQPSTEFPTMNTELLLDQQQLIAKTVIEFPPSMIISDEIEIESDSQWLPIGSKWGDATLLEVRTGSTLDRRRYLLRWNITEESRNKTVEPGANFPQKRSIITTWVPTGDAPLRSILFAECRDRRVRQGILRYARSPGSVWTLDGISSWIPAINSKERLDWPELKDPPLSTNLRIPISSGFGVLRRQPQITTDQLFASNRLHLDSNGVRLTTTIKLSGSVGRKDPLIIEVPLGYKVKEVFSVSGATDYLLWEKDSKTYLQVFSGRQIESSSEFVIESFKELLLQEDEGFELPWPEIKSSLAWTAPPTVAVSALSSWSLEFPSIDTAKTDLKRGQGETQILHQSSFGALDLEPIRVVRSDSRWDGILVVKIPSRNSEIGPQVIGLQRPSRPTSPTKTWAGLELSLPKEAVASWSSINPITELNSLRWSERLLSVDPIDPALSQVASDELESASVDFTIELNPESAASLNSSWYEQIMIDGKSPALIFLATEEPNDEEASALASRSSHPARQDVVPAIANALGLSEQEWKIIPVPLIQKENQSADDNTRFQYVERFAKYFTPTQNRLTVDYWIERQSDSTTQGLLEWSFPVGWTCDVVKINGRVCPFIQRENRLSLFYPPLHTVAHVQMWFSLDPQSIQELGNLATASTDSELPVCESAWVLNPRDPSQQKTALRLETAAWSHALEILGVQARTNANDIWRYHAEQLAALLWESVYTIPQAKGFLTTTEYSQAAGVLASLPWADSSDYSNLLMDARELHTSIRRGIYGKLPRKIDNSIGSGWGGDHSTYELAKVTALLSTVFVGLFIFLRHSQQWLQSRPWWHLLILGLVWWLIAGDLWIPSGLALVSAILVIDSYWMVSVQFRRNAIRVPR